MNTKAVWITGMGVCSPIGQGVDVFWEALCQGQCGIRPLTRLTDDRYMFRQAGEITDLPPALPGEPSTAGAGYRFAATAIAEALARISAPRPWAPDPGAPVGLVLGSNFGDNALTETGLIGNRPDAATSRTGTFATGFQSVADHLAAQFGLQGPRMVLSLSCASGAAAAAVGVSWIRAGRVSRVLVGGVDALSDFWWSGLSALRAMSQDALRPFDVKRSGTIFGEGAAVLMLEAADETGRIQPLARIAGVGLSNNAFHMTAPDKQAAGLGRAMAAALADAGVGAEAIDHVNCHGTGTQLNDLTETQAIKALMGTRALAIPVTANKSLTSHTMGAAGAMEAVASVMTLRTGIVPPTVNLREQDPECDLQVVTRRDARYAVDTVLSNSAGIGGCNAALLLTRTRD